MCFQSRNQTALFPNAGMPQRCRCGLKIRSTLEMIAHAGLPKQMEEMVRLSLWRQRLGATVILRTVLETSLESGAGGVSSWQWRRVIPSTICHYGCSICVCACQATFEENKCNQISNALRKNVEKGSKPIKTAESKREGGRSLYYD